MGKLLYVIIYGLMLSASIALTYGQKISTNKKAQQLYENATTQLQSNNSAGAVTTLKQAIDIDLNFAAAHQQLGDIYRKQNNHKDAVAHYKRVLEIDPLLTSLTKFALGKSFLHLGFYADAIPHLEAYKGSSRITDTGKRKTEKYIKDCLFALAYQQKNTIIPTKLPFTINTYHDEYFPKLTADNQNIIFTRKEDNQENFYESQLLTKNDWSESKKLVGDVNSDRYNEGAHCISPDGKYLFFTGCNRPNGLGSCDIYISKKENGRWSAPYNIGPPINTKGWEAQPAISADGKTLYFVSNRAGGSGGNDIWKSELSLDGQWQTPINLGRSINTEYDESAPYIHADNKTLYFASDGWPGFGGQDLYKSMLEPNDLWTVPLNLGSAINNHFDQTSIHVSMDGSLGFFASQDSTGQLDIYKFTLNDQIRPHPVSYIEGLVRDADSKNPLLARISVTSTQDQRIVFEDQSDYLDGKFIATLPTGENYAVHVQSEGYLFDSKQYDLRDRSNANERFTTEILLQPIKSGKSTQLNNIYFEVNKFELLPSSRSELNVLFQFLKLNRDVRIEIGGHTDNTGSKLINQTLSENRAKAVYTYLVEQGIQSSRMLIKGYGDQLPIATNETAEGKQLNRRTEIKIM